MSPFRLAGGAGMFTCLAALHHLDSISPRDQILAIKDAGA
jgi:hypothetical protein